MPRLGDYRQTHLGRREIAEVTLSLFDQGPDEPSLRSIAAALNVAPASLYHHLPSLAAIFQTAVELVWEEAAVNLIELVPHPFKTDPVEVLVGSAVATRRAAMAHFRLARYMAATPESNEFMRNATALMSFLFGKLGLEGEEAARGLHSYSSFMLGAVLFAAARKAANEPLLERASPDTAGGRYRRGETGSSEPGDATKDAIDRVMDVSIVDPGRDEELFVEGVRRLIRSLTQE